MRAVVPSLLVRKPKLGGGGQQSFAQETKVVMGEGVDLKKWEKKDRLEVFRVVAVLGGGRERSPGTQRP